MGLGLLEAAVLDVVFITRCSPEKKIEIHASPIDIYLCVYVREIY